MPAATALSLLLALQPLSPPECPDFGALEVQLDQRLREITAGLPLAESVRNAERADAFTATDAGGREAGFLLYAEKGSGSIVVSLLCSFDKIDQLVGCKADEAHGGWKVSEIGGLHLKSASQLIHVRPTHRRWSGQGHD